MSKLPGKSLKLLVRFLVSVILLAVIYSTTDLPSLWLTLKTVSWQTALLVALLYAFGQLVSTWKWSFIIRGVGLDRGFVDTIRPYFFGMFVNTFGLGTVGGDVARSLALRPSKGKRAAALATVVADRTQGLLVLATIGAVSILIVRPPVLGSLGVVLAIPAVIVLALGWWLGPKALTWLFPANHRFGHAAAQIGLAFPTKFGPLATITAISASFHTIQIFMHFIIARELGASLELSYLFATVPLVNIAASAPISMNGLGIREAMYLFLFVPAGLSQETAVAFGAIWILAVTAVSALGGLVVGTSSGDMLAASSVDETGDPSPPEEDVKLEQQA